MQSGWHNIIAAKERDKVWKEWNDVVADKRDMHMETVYVHQATRVETRVLVDAYAVTVDHIVAGWIGQVTPLD